MSAVSVHERSVEAGARGAPRPDVRGFFDPRTFSIQYVVSDPATKKAAIVDPVLDFDEKSGQTATHNADAILAYVAEQGLEVEWILDTHPHADHFSAAQYLKTKTGAPTAIGAFVAARGLEVELTPEPQPQAAHFSAASYLKTKTGAPTAIGARVTAVQKLWKGLYTWPDFQADGSQWDRRFDGGDTFTVGT